MNTFTRTQDPPAPAIKLVDDDIELPPEVDTKDMQQLAIARIKAEKARRALAEEEKDALRAAEKEAARIARTKAREGRDTAWRKGKANRAAGSREPLDPSVTVAAVAVDSVDPETGVAAPGGRDSSSGAAAGTSRPRVAPPLALMEVVMAAPLPDPGFPPGERKRSPGPVRMRELDPVGQAELKVSVCKCSVTYPS